MGNIAMGKGDSPEIHFADTVKGSDWGCDQEVAKLFCETVPSMIRQLDHWGVPWNRVTAGKKKYASGIETEDTKDKEGLITARDFGGVAKWRCCYTSDSTGHTVQFVVDTQVCKMGIPVHDRMEAIALIHDGETCFGCVARCLRTGELNVYLARATIIGTGGSDVFMRHPLTLLLMKVLVAPFHWLPVLSPWATWKPFSFTPQGCLLYIF
ncbi:MAG: FAD-binding protein [Candidatus Syntrophopropionicum ammoniitolerans]